VEFVRRVAGTPRALAAFPGAFNPPTRAHLALAQAALAHAEEVLFVIPRRFPHKSFEGASLEDRLRMVEAAIRDHSRFSLAVSEGGLFSDIAAECRREYGPQVVVRVLCGADAARRFLEWDYGRPGAAQEMLREFELLVAPRGEPFHPPQSLSDRIHVLPVPPGYEADSATEVRRRIAAGQAWEHLVPGPIVPLVRELYGR
jgi:nicotinate (nicotinamide) nucleotide adenylyltransferase